jgi:ribosomal protein S20
MPIKKSQIKAMKQANAATARNRAVKADFRAKVKAVKKAAEADGKNVDKLMSEAYQAIDKAAKRNVIHPAAAARRKSRLTAFLTKALKKPVEPKTIKEKTEKPAKTAAKKPATKATTTKKTTKKAA